MANISDLIEQFLLDTIGNEKSMLISRNELAQFFGCAPSQINYVLATRFTVDKGFAINSKRGGGGSITLLRLEEDDTINYLVKTSIGENLNYARMCQMLDRLLKEELVSQRENSMIKAVLGDKAILSYDKLSKDGLRANMFKAFLVCLLQETNGHEGETQ